MNNDFVEPWVGIKYESPDIFPCRTLIVGESRHAKIVERFNPFIVINFVSDDICGDDPWVFGKFSTKIRRVIFGQDGDVGPMGFWGHVAFYTFVQYFVDDALQQRPTHEMWKASVPAFERVVDELKPERILILGLESWRNLLASVAHNPVSEYQAVLLIGPHEVLAGYIHHPSSAMKYDKWRPVARKLLLEK